MNNRRIPLTWRERIGYGGGDFGFNLYWTTIASFLAAFYTDVFGITAAAAGTMLLVTKIVDAFTDPIMGAVADRTKTRFGKFRPYLLFGGFPLAGAGVLAFTTPDLVGGQKLLWAYATYTLLMLCYTILSTPYSALSGVMTASSQQRTALISARFVFAFAGAAFVNKYTLDLVNYFGAGDQVLGWQLTMTLYGALAVIIFTATFATTKEHIVAPAATTSTPAQDIKDLLKNKPWLVLFVLALLIMMTVTMRGGSAYYYFTYFVERPDLIDEYLFSQGIAAGLGAVMAPVLTRYMDKTHLLMLLMGIIGVLSVLLYVIPKDMIWAMFTLNILISFALGPKTPLTWSMYADSADYNEWKTGRRATAMTFSAATFAQKLGSALGGAGMLWILAFIGYVANTPQTNASLNGIALLHTVLPGVFSLVAIFVVRSYPLGGSQLAVMQQELEQRDQQ